MRRLAIDALIEKLAAKGIEARIVYDGPAGYVAVVKASGVTVRTQREAAAVLRKGRGT